jgi:DNA replication protein DnaC
MKTLRQIENQFMKYDLVICDELGYISFDKEGSELLFTNLSLRAGKKSMIITTNPSFDRWQEIFKDPVLTAAMVDRLTHKAYIVNMNEISFRLKETKEWLKKF